MTFICKKKRKKKKRVFHINLLLICVTLQCVVSFYLTTDLCQQQHVISCSVVNVNDTPNYSMKKTQTLLDFISLNGTVCCTVSATWECLEHPACVTESLVVLPCSKLSLIWHTKVKAKSDWSVKTYIQADHNTITPVWRQGNVKV